MPNIKTSEAAMPQLSKLFEDAGFDLPAARGEFETGAGPSFSVLSIRGSKFRVRRAGEEELVKNEDGDPVSALSAVIVRANPNFSKAYYAKGYEEGDDTAPVCYSVDGVRPAADVEQKQSTVCATCPKNQRGSRMTESGQKLKACADVRRVAVVPYPDIENEEHGGPMLLRIPAASLRPLAEYSQKLGKIGWPVFAVATKIGFDPDTSYPRLTFKALKPLSDAEAEQIVTLRSDDRVSAILQSAPELTSEGRPEDEDMADAFAGKEPPAAAKAAAAAEEAPKPKRQVKPKPAPEPTASDENENDDTPMPPSSDTEAALAALLKGL